MSSKKIFVGFEADTGEEAEVPLFHMILTGITQHGKTEELKRLVLEAKDQGYTVLVLDVKNKPEGEKSDFDGFGVEVPIWIAGIADTLSLYGLLESHSGLPLRRELPELARACKKGKTLKGVYKVLKDLLGQEKKIHPVRKDRIEILVLVLESLVKEMDKARPATSMTLDIGQINVMKLAGWSNGFKQLAVNDAVACIREHYRRTIVVFDEAHQQIPQGYGSGSKRTVIEAIKEGAGSQQYIWIADQTIKEVDKDVIAQIPIKIYGGQPGASLRAKETLDHLPVKTWREKKIDAEFVMQLKTGFFLLGERDQTRLIYALPVWMPPPLGRLVAAGRCSPEIAREICLSKNGHIHWGLIEQDDFAESKIRDPEGRSMEQRLKDSEELLKSETEKRGSTIAKLKSDMAKMGKEIERLRKEAKTWDDIVQAKKGKIQSLEKDLKEWEQVKKIFAKIIPGQPYQLMKEPPGEIVVTTQQPTLSVEKERGVLHLTDKNLKGKIALVYADGSLGMKFKVADVVRAFQAHGWKRDPRISMALATFAQWGYIGIKKEGKQTIYLLKVTPDEAKKRGLLKTTEKMVE